MKPKFNPNKIGSGELRTTVSFYQYAPHNGPEPGEGVMDKVNECFAEVYNAGMKDIEILNSGREQQQLKFINTKNAVTLNIRDSFGEYFPDTEHYAELQDYRYSKMVDGERKYIRFNVIDVRPNLTKNDFITVLLAVIT
ncbi:phage head-tail adapter protein [Peribacillus butanolivorans]|uniref:phage head-tail adapter protein n=1 Tax=Peribacillus butanolivorans TaxID=421767 RepID=UPI0035DA1058